MPMIRALFLAWTDLLRPRIFGVLAKGRIKIVRLTS